MIDDVLELSHECYNRLQFIVYKCLLLFINQASILIDDTMVIRVEGSRNLLSREDLQWVSRMCCLLSVGR